MTVKPAIEVEGARELRRKLRDVEGSAADLKAAHKAAADIVAEQARFEVPVRSGRLKATIRPLASKTRAQVAAGRGKQVPYAGPVHFGWPTRPNRQKGWRGGPIRPQPFLYDAVDRRQGEVLRAFDRHIDRIIRGADLD